MFSRYVGVGIGVWYVVAPFAWGYDTSFLWWHSVLLGAAVLALSSAHLVKWSSLSAHVMVLVGVYSMLSPFLHVYLQEASAFFNDLVFGILTIGTAVALAANAIEVRARPREA